MAETQALQTGKIFLGKGIEPEYLELRFANRHGLIAGATGTGKTVTLQVLAESFSDVGVPIFAPDIKGDLSGLAAQGGEKDYLVKRAAQVGLKEYRPRAYPVTFWDLFGEQGHPIRTTLQDMGPLLLSRLLELNEVQEGVLNICFRISIDEQLPLLDLQDLKALIQNLSDRSKEISKTYGNITTASVGSIQRRLLVLEEQGARNFFGEPAFDFTDMLRVHSDGRGVINILSAERLMQSPRLYSTFLLWMLTKLWQILPEVGDLAQPKLVFFFDEAHLLFSEAPKALLERIEQVVRLIRSKGVGIYFISQNPLDIPNTVAAQLGNRIQHALRAFTPQEQKAVKAAATTFRKNPKIDTETAMIELQVGEALISTLENKGEPSIVERTLIRPPEARVGPLTQQERTQSIQQNVLYGKYENALNRESAHEILKKRLEQSASVGSDRQSWTDILLGGGKATSRGRRTQSMGEMIGRELQRSLSRTIATSIKNIIIGTIKGRGR